MGNQCQILYTSPSVVFITSIAGFQPQGSMAVYGVTKTALLGLTKRWALNDSFEASDAAIEGHDILMATMLNGAVMMDGVLLLIAADETCPPDEIDAYAATETVTEELPEVSPLDDTGAAFSTVTEELPEVNGTPEYLAAGSMSSISDIDTTIRITFSLKKVS